MGLNYETKVKENFLTLIQEIPGYEVKESPLVGVDILFENKVYATCYQKHQFYQFLSHQGVSWQDIISKKILPDDALLVIQRETLFVIEVKYQQVAGSVDEKLQTCDFKRKQYLKLVSSLGLKVEYVYILNDWFKKPQYKDVLEYIHSVNCDYKFNRLPLAWLGLPIAKTIAPF